MNGQGVLVSFSLYIYVDSPLRIVALTLIHRLKTGRCMNPARKRSSHVPIGLGSPWAKPIGGDSPKAVSILSDEGPHAETRPLPYYDNFKGVFLTGAILFMLHHLRVVRPWWFKCPDTYGIYLAFIRIDVEVFPNRIAYSSTVNKMIWKADRWQGLVCDDGRRFSCSKTSRVATHDISR